MPAKYAAMQCSLGSVTDELDIPQSRGNFSTKLKNKGK
jgi:hypothetical protein